MPLIPKQQPPYYTPETGQIKIYEALLNQTGTNAPIATILQNTLDGTPVWTRTGEGEYLCTLTGAFTLNKTQVKISSTSQNYDTIMPGLLLGLNSFPIYTYYNGDDTNYDDNLIQTPITIKVYP